MNPNCNKVVIPNFFRMVVRFLHALVVVSLLNSANCLLCPSALAQPPSGNTTALGTPPETEIPASIFAIRVVDAETKRGVPLKTIHHVQYVTDNLGWVAIDNLDLLDRSVFFTVESPGYAFAKDGFGFSGTRIDCTPDSSINGGDLHDLSRSRNSAS